MSVIRNAPHYIASSNTSSFGCRPYELPSWAVVAALADTERRTVRRWWLSRVLWTRVREPAGAGVRGGSDPGAGHCLSRLASRCRERVRAGALRGESHQEARTPRAAGEPVRGDLFTRVSAREKI